MGEHDCLVSADLDGYLYFWGITPSPRKEKLLAKVSNINESEIKTEDWFPIKAMDFDIHNNCLYTGDEMGNLNKWDCNELLKKLEEVKQNEKKSGSAVEMLSGLKDKRPTMLKQETTFITGTGAEGSKGPIVFKNDDVKMVYGKKAHSDGITWVCFVPE